MGASLTAGNILNPRSPFAKILLATTLCTLLLIYSVRISPTRFTVQSSYFEYGLPPSEAQSTGPETLSLGQDAVDCSLNATALRSLKEKYGLGSRISYGRRYVRFQRKDIARKSLTKLDEKLFPEGFDLVDLENPTETPICTKSLEITVPNSPYPYSVNASNLLFGVSTTYKRLADTQNGPIKEWAHWLTDGRGNSNGAGLILRLVDASAEEIDEATKAMISVGIDVKVYASDSSVEMAKRYLSILPELYNDSSRPNREWLILCDDDTFFPAMHAFIKRLETYDRQMDLYIGTLSEDVNNIQRHGTQAFGGAGVIFSLPLAEKITKLYESCSTPQKIQESNTGWGAQGDILMRNCIYENTEVRLSLLRDLHQMDLMGDPSGFYESGIAPLSLHHFKGGIWHKARPYEGAYITRVCGEDCFLQRFQTVDNFIISNGYSVAYYPNGVDFNTDQMERTFTSAPDDYGWNLDVMLGPARVNLLWTGRKASWELRETTRTTDGALKQVYIRKADDSRWTIGRGGERMFDVDGVVELIWLP